MEMNYTIGTGYFGHGEFKSQFAKVWMENTRKFSSPKTIVCITVGPCEHPYDDSIQKIILDGNLGYNDHNQKYDHCGWSGAVFALAMIAYCNETDFIYKEQDCLAFGDWPRKMYEEIGDAKVILGVYPGWFSANSLFLVKHDYIPWFVADYLSTGPERGDIAEGKFARLKASKPKIYKMFSFGYDRVRPVNYDDPVFYIQHVRPEEFEHMKNLKLI